MIASSRYFLSSEINTFSAERTNERSEMSCESTKGTEGSLSF